MELTRVASSPVNGKYTGGGCLNTGQKLRFSQLPNQHGTTWAVTSTAKWADCFWECRQPSGFYSIVTFSYLVFSVLFTVSKYFYQVVYVSYTVYPFDPACTSKCIVHVPFNIPFQLFTSEFNMNNYVVLQTKIIVFSNINTVLYLFPMQNFMLNQPYSMYDFGWCNLETDVWINHETDAWVNLN